MEYFNYFFFNYSSLGSLLTTIISLGASVFLFTLPNKSKSTLFLAATFFIITLSGSGYIFSTGSYYPNTWHRIMTMSLVPFRFIFLIQFLMRYPNNDKPRFNRIVMYSTLASGVLIDIYFMSVALPAKSFFDLSGHSYEIFIPDFFRHFSLYITFLLLIAFVVSIWKIKVSRGNERKAMLAITLGLVLDLLIPLILNILQRNGFITREMFFSVMAFMTPIGSFLILVAFINTTKDKSTFMFKIISISFLTFVLIFNVIIYMFMTEREESYSFTHRKELKIILTNYNDQKDNEVDYILEYYPNSGETKYTYNRDGYEIFEIHDRLVNSYIYETIKTLPPDSTVDDIKYRIKNLNLVNAKYAQGHIEMILLFLDKYRDSNPINDLLLHIDKQERILYYLSNKIKEIPDNKFMGEMQDFIQKNRSSYEDYLKVVAVHLATSASERDKMKSEVLRYFTPILPETTKYFRQSKLGDKHFVAFQESTPDVIYEIGFNYIEYRNFLHTIGKKLFFLLFLAIFLIFVGTPIFLSGALMKPLNELLSGLRLVRKGDLDVEVPVHVQDEIGYLANSFNSMVSAIRDAKGKLEDYSNQLEMKVEERTKELQLSLTKVEELKTQQDGDYFLTTLLLKPLGVNNAITDGKVKVDFFVKQKKQFQFKKRLMEIGGDMCITQTLFLRGKKYITFINADAMGKSMQGAGGVLVLGSVFHSIVQRTSMQKGLSEIPPEVWIKTTFKELHKIFESFDGSMLVSIIFGLVEEESGMMYYINAEHPWLVLYRDEKARFIEDDSYFRKLGTAGVKSEIFVNTFQMQSGDLIIMGSDGKDDLVLESSDDGMNRVINEDETLFLSRVEEAKGDLFKIYDVIVENFELMDDLSLLSIKFLDLEEKDVADSKVNDLISEASFLLKSNETSSAIALLENGLSQNPNSLDLVDFLMKVYLKNREYEKGTGLAKDFFSRNEANSEFMLRAAYCMKMSRDIESAIDLSERVKLREPGNVKNLIHLADMYAYTRNYKRASKLITKVLQIEPENEQAKKIFKMISESIDS
ncbi:MAG: SpoIIE family protein phosphatase [Leptospiraceae bacterium]|nr:SpoIIE family protein phosphatase [Leptospiraceae bacterium]MCP5510301.1 SpoIIE family protein phosphatase [Leptospiraceae bacterium]